MPSYEETGIPLTSKKDLIWVSLFIFDKYLLNQSVFLLEKWGGEKVTTCTFKYLAISIISSPSTEQGPAILVYFQLNFLALSI